MSQKKIALVTVLASIAFLACSAPASSDGPKGGADAPSGAAKKESGSGAASPSGEGTTTPTTPGADSPDDAGEDGACYAACKTQHPQGAQLMDDLEKAWKTCACGACAAQCASSFCGATGTEPAEGDACATCLEGAAQCNTQWDTACDANASCVAFGECEAACEPDDADDQSGAAPAKASPARPTSSRTHRAYVRP